jgi:uroporphyrinogen-III decarboxylase
MYRERILPLHRELYEHGDPGGPRDGERSMHLCGDATRHFPTIHEELGVTIFDTGFPVDHGRLREQLGDDVLVQGGPAVGLLVSSGPDEVYEQTRNILESGVRRGGRFLLREGNNLPPEAKDENLAAMYAAALEHGGYDKPASA